MAEIANKMGEYIESSKILPEDQYIENLNELITKFMKAWRSLYQYAARLETIKRSLIDSGLKKEPPSPPLCKKPEIPSWVS